jgi:hypothetical protein
VPVTLKDNDETIRHYQYGAFYDVFYPSDSIFIEDQEYRGVKCWSVDHGGFGIFNRVNLYDEFERANCHRHLFYGVDPVGDDVVLDFGL